MIRRWFILGILIALMVALLWNFYTEVVVYDPMDSVMKTVGRPKAKDKTKAAYSPGWGEEIVARNLFSPYRGYSPPPPPPGPSEDAAGPPAPPEPPPKLLLSGIILDQYGEHVAFVKLGDGPPRKMRVGDEFDGLSVVGIDDRSVTLMWNEEEITLSMKNTRTLQRD